MNLVRSSQAETAVAMQLRFEGHSPHSLGAGIYANDPGQFIEIPSKAASTNTSHSFKSSTCESESLTEPHARARSLALYSCPRKG